MGWLGYYPAHTAVKEGSRNTLEERPTPLTRPSAGSESVRFAVRRGCVASRRTTAEPDTHPSRGHLAPPEKGAGPLGISLFALVPWIQAPDSYPSIRQLASLESTTTIITIIIIIISRLVIKGVIMFLAG